MATPKETIWELDPHTRAKHAILRRYLGAWFPILGSYHGRIVYIDGFSGPGRYRGGEPGSPVVALEVALNHRRSSTGEIVFWFIEEREDRLAHLKQELGALKLPPHFKAISETGRFAEKFAAVLASMEAGGSAMAPTFAFIDPFGFSGIPLALIQRLLGHKRSEVFITFMVDAINRFLEHPDEKVVEHIVAAFGGDEAVRIAKGTGDRVVKLRELYQRKLSEAAKYVRYFEMRDRQDRIQYYLFFASNSEVGHLKMKEAMWTVDPNGDFRFSDSTDPNQLVLFGTDASQGLASQLRSEFRGKGKVSGLQVRTYVENRTAYLKKHMTAVLRQQEEKGEVKVDQRKTDGKKRRANTYPDDVRLTWV